MGFAAISGQSRLNPGPGIVSGSVGLGVSTAAQGQIEHRPMNTFGGALNLYALKDDALPRASLIAGFGGPKLVLGAGELGATTFGGAAGGWNLNLGPTTGSGLAIMADSNGWAIDAAGAAGLKGARLSVRGPVTGGINDPDGGDTIFNGSNGPNGTFFNMIDVQQSGGNAVGTRGSLHQFQGSLEVVNMPGQSGDVYCESFNHYHGITAARKGALIGNWESTITIKSGFPARVAGLRAIIRDENLLSAYDPVVFGLSQNWWLTGARGFEAISMPSSAGGTPRRAGTGVLIHGIQGWECALQVLDTTAQRVSGIDGNGGVWTKVKAGAPVDADFRVPMGGMMVWDDTNNKFYVRKANGTWKSSAVFT